MHPTHTTLADVVSALRFLGDSISKIYPTALDGHGVIAIIHTRGEESLSWPLAETVDVEKVSAEEFCAFVDRVRDLPGVYTDHDPIRRLVGLAHLEDGRITIRRTGLTGIHDHRKGLGMILEFPSIPTALWDEEVKSFVPSSLRPWNSYVID